VSLSNYALHVVGSTLSLIGSERRNSVPTTKGSQRVRGYNPLLACSPTVTCSPKTEPKVAKKFKRKSSIPIQICLSKNGNIQIHQYIAVSQVKSNSKYIFSFGYFHVLGTRSGETRV